MDCPQCGASIIGGAVSCAVCGRSMAAANSSVTFPDGVVSGRLAVALAAGVTPPNMLGWAVVATLLCMPVGVVSIVYAAQAGTLWQQGDYAGSVVSNGKARMWAWIALGAAVVYLLSCAGLGLLLGFAIANSP